MYITIVSERRQGNIRGFITDMEDAIYEYKNSNEDEDDKEKLIKAIMHNTGVYHSISHLLYAYQTVFNNACNPCEDVIEFHPGFEFNHVSNEQ